MSHDEEHDNPSMSGIMARYMKNLKQSVASGDMHSRWCLPSVTFLIICSFIFVIQIPVTAVENQSLTCGIILPLSGDLNASGITLLQGIQLATDEINLNGGTAEYLITLRIADDQGDPEKALSLFREMQADGIPVVIGSYSTAITHPMAEETKNSENIILISPRANGEILYGISPRFYQVNAPIFSVTRFVADWLSYTADRIAIIYTDDEYGRSVLDRIRSGLDNSSVVITGAQPITMENTDYSVISENILDDAPDAIVISIYDSRQILIIRNLTEAGFRGQVILTESGFINTLESEENEALSKFSLFIMSSNSYLVPGEFTDRFVKAYREKFGQDPERTIAGYGYDSMMVLANAIRLGSLNGTISAGSIQKGLDDSRYYGVTGPKAFDSHHAVLPVLDRWIFKDGKFTLMTTSLF